MAIRLSSATPPPSSPTPLVDASLSIFRGPPHPLGIPPLDAPNEELFFENWDSDSYAIETTNNVCVNKAILTSSPLDPSCMVFVNADSFWLLSFCKIGDKHWTVIEFDFQLPLEYNISDFTYSNGGLYAIDHYGFVTVYNLHNPSRLMLDCPLGTHAMYLVGGVSDDLLLMSSTPSTYDDEVIERNIKYTVYKLSKGEVPEWIELRDIGQKVLFLGGDHHAISLSSANMQFPGLGRNCLCYDSINTEIYIKEQSWSSLYNHNIILARLDDGKVTSKTGDLVHFKRIGIGRSLYG